MKYKFVKPMFLGFSGLSMKVGDVVDVDKSAMSFLYEGRKYEDFRDIDICLKHGFLAECGDTTQDRAEALKQGQPDANPATESEQKPAPAGSKKSRIGGFNVVKGEDTVKTIKVAKTASEPEAEPTKNISQTSITDLPVKKGKVVGESHGHKIIKSDASEETGRVVNTLPKCTPESKKNK